MAIIFSGRAEVVTSAIGYKNLFIDSGVTVTASSDQVGYEKENAIDWKQYDWWKPTTTGSHWLRASFSSAKTADYMAVWGHNLHQVGGSVKPQYSTDAGATWLDADSEIAASTGNTIYIGFNSVLAADWRCLVVTTTGVSIIAGVQIGERTTLDKGLTPGLTVPALAPIVETKTAMSEMGVNLGATIKKTGVSGRIELTNLDPLWVRSNFADLVTHLNSGKPCVFAWDSELHQYESLLIWKKGNINPPTYSGPLLMSTSISYDGIL